MNKELITAEVIVKKFQLALKNKEMIIFHKALVEQNEIYPGAGLIPVHRDRICLLKPPNSDTLEIAKGGVDPGESYESTAIREAEEEIGYIHKENYDLFLFHEIEGGIKVYYVIVDDPRLLEPEDPYDETESVHWVEMGSAIKNVPDWQKEIIKKLRSQLA